MGTTYLLLFFLLIVFPISTYILDYNFINIILISFSFYFMRLAEIYIISTRFIEKDIKSILPRAIPYLVLITLFLVFRPGSITSLLLILLISWIVTLFYIYSLKGYFSFQKLNIKSLYSNTILLSLSILTTQVYANIDQLMISEFLGDTKLGIYKIGVSFSVLAMPLVGVFSFIFLSTLKEKLKNDSIELIKKSFYNQIKINFWLSLAFAICCIIFLEFIIEYVYDLKEKDAYHVAVIMAIGVIFNVVTMVFSYSFLAIKKDKEIFVITLIGALINIILNYFFIKSFGILGAAWSSLITQLLILLLFIYIFYFRINFFNSIKQIS